MVYAFLKTMGVHHADVDRLCGYDITSSKSSLWLNHGKICDFVCLFPIKPSMLNFKMETGSCSIFAVQLL